MNVFWMLWALVLLCVGWAPQILAADRPNFVWIVSEDNSKHFVKLFDPTGAAMPNVESMAAHGLIFEHAFSNAPVCSTARTTLATSSYGPRMALHYHRRAKPVNLPAGYTLYNTLLRRAGYYTANNAKSDYNFVWPQGADKPWDESSGKASWRKRPDGAPFFYMTSNGVTHEGRLHSDRKTIQAELVTDPESVSLAPVHPDTELFRQTYARYHDRHALADAWVGQVLADLEADGLLEDTFVFYFGDHGGVLPGSKGYPNERGLHVPLVVRVPDHFKHLVPAAWANGSRIKGFVSFVDFGPTLLKLAGIEPSADYDGQAFLGQGVQASEVLERDTAYAYADRFDEKLDFVRTVRIGDLKYVRNYWPHTPDGLHNEYRYRQLAFREWRDLYHAGLLNPVQAAFFEAKPAEQLFDIARDPFETHNLADDPAYAADLKRLRGALHQWIESMPDLSFVPEPALVADALDDPVAYGAANRERLLRYKAAADLQLLPFAEAEKPLVGLLGSDDPIERYWGLVVSCAFGEKAKAMIGPARDLLRETEDPILMARAAEFLGLLGVDDPRPIVADALGRCQNLIECIWVLHSATVLKDVKGVTFPGLAFIPSNNVPSRRHGDWGSSRLDYVSR